MLITGIWMTKKEIQHIAALHAGAEEWSFSPRWKWASRMPLSTAPMRASVPTWYGKNLSLKLRLQAPNSDRTSSPEKSASISMTRSLAHISPPKAPLSLANLHHEETPLEIVRDTKETLAVSTECRLLEQVSIDILLASSVSFSPWSKSHPLAS